MGLLDDAIREHLELKRQHGADLSEVERQEQEALGPVRRREAEEPAGGEAGPQPEDFAADAPTTAYVPEPDPSAPGAVAAGDAEIEPPVEEESPSPGHEAAGPGYDEDPYVDDDEQPKPGDEQPRPADEASAPAGEDDVLEETPDFLQETPEHDRLWFEQKPPRDFDWDQ
jgi:hypothetical protein